MFEIINYKHVIKDLDIEVEDSIENPDFIFELPKPYGGTLDTSSIAKSKESMMAFDIKTGAQEA